MNKNRLLAFSAVLILLFSATAIFTLNDEPLKDLNFTLLDDRVQEVDHGETAIYHIDVVNNGEYKRNLPLVLTGVPEHWNASVDRDYVSLSENIRTTITLEVTAPSVNAAGSRGVPSIANVGIRGGNVTIGTITILKGSASVQRNGTIFSLQSNNEILSGDIITAEGSSVISLGVPKLLHNGTGEEGEIYVLLHDAVVGFLRYQDTGYLTIISGDVTVWVPGGGGGGGISGRADTRPSISVNLSGNSGVQSQFPDKEIRANIEFMTLPEEECLFFLDFETEDTVLEVFHGSVELRNDNDNIEVEKYMTSNAKKENLIPNPLPVEKKMVILESNNSVEGTVSADGENVWEQEDCQYLRMNDRDIILVPFDISDIGVNLTGRTTGDYSLAFTTVEELVAKSFEITTSASLKTDDKIVLKKDRLNLGKMESDKTYDISITGEDASSGETQTFEALYMKTSAEEQSFTVKDWAELNNSEEKPVTISQGEKETEVSTGITGGEFEEDISEEESTTEMGSVTIALLVLFLFAVVGVVEYIFYKKIK